MADDARQALLEAGIVFADACPPDAECGLDRIHDMPRAMSVPEIEAEIAALQMACEIQQSVLSELYLAVDKATFGLRESRERIDLLRAEVGRRRTSRSSS